MTTETAQRIEIASAAVKFACKRSNKIPAKQYQAAVRELLEAQAQGRIEEGISTSWGV